MPEVPRYDADFYVWTQDQARRLREAAAARVNLPVDWENLAEEVEDLGSHKVHAAQSALVRILEHLIKLACSPALLPRRGWRRSVLVHRDRLNRLLEESGSIEARLDLDRAFAVARSVAAEGLRQDRSGQAMMPVDCPLTLEQIRDEDWWPANHHGLED